MPFLSAVEDAEKHFLSAGRHRGADLESAVRLFLEFLKGFEALDLQGPCVTVFGSARFGDGHPYYETARAARRRTGPGRLRRHDRRRAGPHGGRQPRRARGGRHEPRLQHPPAARAEAQRLPRPLRRVRALLRAQGDAGQVLLRLRGHARRLRHAGRGLRGDDADPERQARILSRGGHRRPVLAVSADFPGGHAGAGGHH